MRESLRTFGFTVAAFVRPRLGRTHLDRYRLRELRRLLLHAAAHVPLYRDRFRASDFDPRSVVALDDLRRAPLTGKEELHELRRSLGQETIDRLRLIEHKTSGSTGSPVRILRSPAEERRLNMLRWRLQWMLGLRPGDRVAAVRTTWEPLDSRFDRLQDLARSFRLVDNRVFDCFRDPAETYGALVAFRPHVLAGYPGALVRVALHHEPRSGALRCLRRVTCGGENLAPHQRRLLEERFGVPVHDVYGASECNLVAWRCPETGAFHVNDDGVLLEVCRDGQPVAEGAEGEVVITSLHSRTMPIIRYAMGDLAVAGPPRCPCGSPFSTIRELRGRTIDHLTLPDGRELHPFVALNEIVARSGDWIVEYQLVQEAPDRLLLEIVPRRSVADADVRAVDEALRAVLGAACHLRIALTERIPRDASGKLHFCRSAAGRS